jgi:hypothetical protein
MRIDQQNRLWLLDFAMHGILGVPKLVAFQLDKAGGASDTVSHEYTFPGNIAGFGSMLNDFQVHIFVFSCTLFRCMQKYTY